jgi:phosphoserine phosphatase RsbU/P
VSPTANASVPRSLAPILAVAAKLAAPFDLRTMLVEVVSAARQVLGADRGAVWLYDAAADELVLEVASDLKPVRVPAGSGLVGTCARNRQVINVPDCYADPRFDRTMDGRSGYRTRCMLTLPLIDHRDELVGVMQLLNRAEGVFDADDEALATVLAAQCAIALQRVRMTEAVIEGEKMRQQLEMARVVQMATLPATMPAVSGYDVYGTFEPADLTGGDTYDLEWIDQGLLVVLGDATGHGIAPALSATQMQAMLRLAFRMGADLDTAFRHVNNQLAEMLAADRFITAFIGLLDPPTHTLEFQSGGQGPILRYRAASGEFDVYKPTSFPLAAMPIVRLQPAVRLTLEAGDILVLLSDGVYEAHDPEGEPFGEERVRSLVREHRTSPMADLAARILEAVRAFTRGAPPEDDLTLVLLRREVLPATAHWSFPRRIEAVDDIARFTREVFASHRIDEALLPTVDLALEEFFTNMVKYGGGDIPVKISMDKIPGGVEVTLVDTGVDRFDPRTAPVPDLGLPLEQRTPGGLGLYLVGRTVEGLEYHYDEARREGRTRFRKTSGAGRGDAGN